MARAVLTGGRFVAAALVLLASSLAQGKAPQCPTDLSASAPADKKNQVRAFQQALVSGAFYKELSRRGGKPLTCEVAMEDGGIKISFAFRGSASLVAQVSAGNESTGQRMEARKIGAKAAMALLRRAEQDAFGQDGCGIVWDKPAEELPGAQPGSREVVYRGDACNCQARLVYAGNSIVALVLRSAC
jgi:hypothetical protein